MPGQVYELWQKAERRIKREAVEIIPYAPLRLRGRYQFIPVNAVCREGTWTFYRDFHSAYHARLKSLLEKLSLESRLVEIGKRADVPYGRNDQLAGSQGVPAGRTGAFRKVYQRKFGETMRGQSFFRSSGTAGK